MKINDSKISLTERSLAGVYWVARVKRSDAIEM